MKYVHICDKFTAIWNRCCRSRFNRFYGNNNQNYIFPINVKLFVIIQLLIGSRKVHRKYCHEVGLNNESDIIGCKSTLWRVRKNVWWSRVMLLPSSVRGFVETDVNNIMIVALLASFGLLFFSLDHIWQYVFCKLDWLKFSMYLIETERHIYASLK